MKLSWVLLRDRCEVVVGAAGCPCFLFNSRTKEEEGWELKKSRPKRLTNPHKISTAWKSVKATTKGSEMFDWPAYSLIYQHQMKAWRINTLEYPTFAHTWVIVSQFRAYECYSSSRNSLGFVDWLAVSHCGMPPGGPGLHIHSHAHSQSEHNHHQIDEQEDDECFQFHRKSDFQFNIVIWCALPQPSELCISWQIFGESTEFGSTLPLDWLSLKESYCKILFSWHQRALVGYDAQMINDIEIHVNIG